MPSVRPYTPGDLSAMRNIWNEVVRGGTSFPQREELNEESATAFFAAQSRTAVACEDGHVLGLYILHPNNVGRCSHIANASYAVASSARGCGVGELLVRDSLEAGAALGFRILQFNAVVRTNAAAIHLYEKLGFVRLGIIPGGFSMDGGQYEDIIPMYHTLSVGDHQSQEFFPRL